MQPIPILEDEQVFINIKGQQNKHFESYYAFYSSWFGGILKNPHMMLLPMDDHMVHRGDGVFEAMKSIARSVYLLDEHLYRLFQSAEKIGLHSPYSVNDIKEIVLQTLQAANKSDVLIRIYLSRGPGNFSSNPYDSMKPQLYVIITNLAQPSVDKYEQGVRIGKSTIPVKNSWHAQVKSCNYLSNVLMKKEATDKGFDFVIGVDEGNYITEGACENILIIDQNGSLAHPPLDFILKGTMMTRVCELASDNGISVNERLISCEELKTAREVIMTGTSINILPVISFDDHIIGNGKPGQISKMLHKFIVNDINEGSKGTPFV